MTDTTSAGDGGGLVDLIARLERAEGADRGLDSAIHAEMLLTGWTPEFWDESLADPELINPSIPEARPYTSSLDAALTLVPEGLDWLICSRRRNFQDGYYVHIMNGDVNRDGRSVSEAWHPIPAIALCIAALKARSATP